MKLVREPGESRERQPDLLAKKCPGVGDIHFFIQLGHGALLLFAIAGHFVGEYENRGVEVLKAGS